MRTPALSLCALPDKICAAVVRAIGCAVIAGGVAVYGQAGGGGAGVSAAAADARYADEAVVIDRSDIVYSFAADGTGFRERTVAARVQSEAAVRALGVVTVPYAGDSEQVEFVYARVRRADGTVVETPGTDAQDLPQDVTRAAPFYSDLKEKQLPIRSLRVGDTLEWKARIVRRKAEAPGEFWGAESFADDAVALEESVELRVPQGSSVNVWSPTVKPAESAADGQHIYRWTASQLKPTAGKEAEAAAEAKKKQVWTADEEVDADQGKLPEIAWTTFKSWDEVGAWYRGLEADRVAANAEVKAKAAELTAGKTTDEEKVRALYGYVSTQIRYIGVAFGVGRYQPHTAAEILSNQYGDCKDKHTLLAAMLGAVGMDADAVLIGAGVRFNEAVPSPAAFNHVITHLTVAGQPVWLDSTAEIAPYRMLVSVIRDRQALVVPAVGAVRIERTPPDPPFASFQTMEAVGTLDENGTSKSRLTYVVRGDTELLLRSAFHQTSPGQYNQVLQQISYGTGYAGTTSNPEITSPENTAEPFKMSYDYEREKAGDWDHYQIIPQLAPISLTRFDDKDPLVRTLDLGTPRVEMSHSAMKIPEGWTAILPEAQHFKSAYATYDLTYRFENGTVYAERRIEVLKQKVLVTELTAYKKWADDADLGNERYIQLTKHDPRISPEIKSSDKGTAPAPASAGTIAAASAGGGDAVRGDPAKLLQEAYVSLQQRDITGATKLLNEANAINPEFNGLWAMYGLTALQHFSAFDAIEDFHKELKLHPDAYQVYPMLLQAHKLLDQHKEMEDTLREWAAAETSNPAPSTQLMEMLVSDGDGGSAMAAGESALAHLPEEAQKNEPFRLALGHAEIAAGEKGKGSAALEALLKTSQDAGVLNDTAYVLADASLDLPLAESSARAALDKLAEESNTWTLDESPQTLLAKTNLTVATWDTLGWALFREGKLEEAESYLKAGWVGSLNVETGRHLGEVQAARGDKSGALTTYELAIASEPGYNSLGVRKEPSAKVKELQARAEALRRAGAKSSAGVAQNGLLELRKVALGAADGRSGDAEYKLLLKGGKAVKVEQSGSKSVAGAEETISKASFARLFPAGSPAVSPAVLVRAGYVNCHSGVCELLLEPLR